MKVLFADRLKVFIELIKMKLNKKQFILFSSILVGLSVGLAAIVLKTFVHYIYLATTYKGLGDIKYLLCYLFLGFYLLLMAVKKILRGKFEKGLSNIHYASQKNRA